MQQRNGAVHFVANELQIQRNVAAAFRFAHRFESLTHDFFFGVSTEKEPHGQKHNAHDLEMQCPRPSAPYSYAHSFPRMKICESFNNGLNSPSGMFKHGGWELNSGNAQALGESRTDAGGHEVADDLAGFANATFAKDEDVLHGDDIAFHAGDFRDVGDFTSAVTETRDLNDYVDRRSNLPADGAVRNVQAGHGDHGFQAADSVARGVRVNGGERSIVTGVHGLQHVERFFAANLTNDDAVGAHTQTVDEQLPLMDGAFAFDVGRARFQAYDVILVKLQFGGVFDGDDALAVGDVRRKNIEEGGFTGASTAGNQNVEASLYAPGEQFQHRLRSWCCYEPDRRP